LAASRWSFNGVSRLIGAILFGVGMIAGLLGATIEVFGHEAMRHIQTHLHARK
jgi:hypothetical protein